MKTAIITGASSGIGLALAKCFAVDGYRLILVSENQERLSAASESLQKLGATVMMIRQDLTSPDAAKTVVDELRAQKVQVDVLINNAGFATAGAFSETNFEREAAEIQLNIVALTQLTKLLLPDMLRQGEGKILLVASVAAFMPGPFMAVYYATKAYVLHFGEALAEELQGSGVSVSVLCPGPTATSFATTAKLSKKRMFSGKLPTADEVVAVAYKGLTEGKRVIVPGLRNKTLHFLLRFLPRRLVLRYVATLQR